MVLDPETLKYWNYLDTGLQAGGTGLIVANKDATATNLEADACDPWAAKAENGTNAPNHGNIRPLRNPGGAYLHLYHIWDPDSAAPDNVTHPIVQVFGLVRPSPQGRNHWPSEGGLPTLDQNDDGFWLPLIDPDETNDHMQFEGAVGMYHASDTDDNDFFISKPKTLYTQGFLEFLVMVHTAAANVDNSVIGAQFSG